MLFVYAKPNQMKEHGFTDDVAICDAKTKKEALEIFRRLYIMSGEEAEKYIKEVQFNNYGIAILTDY